MELPEVAGPAHGEPSTLPSTTSLTSFALFPKFPIELRLLIWSHCLPDPRVINVVSHIKREQRRRQLLPGGGVRIVHPTILAVNQESRSVALENYAMLQLPMGCHLAFNSERDTIYCPEGYYLSPWRSEEIKDSTAMEYGRKDDGSKKIRKIIFDGRLDSWFLRIQDCGDLEELSIVVDHGDYLFGAGQNERVMALGEQVRIPSVETWKALPTGLKVVWTDLRKLFGKGGKSEGKTLVLKLVKGFKGESAGEEFCVPLTANSLSRE